MNSMTYEDAVRYLYSFLNYEVQTDYVYRRDLDLARMAYLTRIFGKPHERIPFILVGGTKGKGSTAFILSSLIKEAGYRAGLYTSPHLETPCERIQISGVPLAKEDFAALLEKVKTTLSARPVPGRLGPATFFEVLTAAALLYFAEHGVDLAVLEVGLGGRLDATNIVRPLVSILTPVSYDHQDKLGKTLEKIAREKIPIVKEKSLFVSGRQSPAVERIFRGWAARKRTAGFFLGREFGVERVRLREEGSTFDFRSGENFFGDLLLALPGRFQVDNAACAIETARILDSHQLITIGEEAVRAGLLNGGWPGRFQVIRKDPLVVLDGAHNGASMRALLDSVGALFPARRIRMILAVSRDKDIRRMAREIARSGVREVLVTQSKNTRACPPEILAARLGSQIPRVAKMPGLKQAIELALRTWRAGDLLLITGSLFLVGEAKTLFESSPETVQVA